MDPGLIDLFSNKISLLGYVNFYVEIEMEKINGKPDHLSLNDWCEHQQEVGHHFRLKKPAYDENNHSFSTFYRYKVYEILNQYTFISGCLNKDCYEKGTFLFVDNGFTSSRKNDGTLYNSIPENKKDNTELLSWVLAIKFLHKNNLAIVHSNGCVYRYIPDFRFKDLGDIGNVKLLLLKGCPDSAGYRNFLCLGCHNLSKEYTSNRTEIYNDHCYRYHAVKSRGTTIGSNLYFEVVISYVIENGAPLRFASKKNSSTMGIIKRIGFPAKVFYDKHVREAVININKLLHQRFVESSVDNSFIPLNLDEENLNICNLVTEMTKKIHTFICITEDGWSDWKNPMNLSSAI